MREDINKLNPPIFKMSSLSGAPRRLLIVTLLILLALVALILYLHEAHPPDALSLNTDGQPTLGNPQAKIHLVVFEEPRCLHCQKFNNDIFPILKTEYIDTQKILYTVIPVSFLPGSMPIAVAALCVRHQDPEHVDETLFFSFLNHNYQQERTSDELSLSTLLKFGEAISYKVQLDSLKNCLKKSRYYTQIEENTEYGKQVMGGMITTPTVYINGVRIKQLSLEGLRELIEEKLEES